MAHTELTGHISVEPALNADEIAYLSKFAGTRRMDRGEGPYHVLGTGSFGQGDDRDIRNYNAPPEGQPSLWCEWIPTEDGTRIEWSGTEKFEKYLEWMRYLIDHFLKPGAVAKTQTVDGERFFTFSDHTLDGVIEAQCGHDRWYLVVNDNHAGEVDALPGGPAFPGMG